MGPHLLLLAYVWRPRELDFGWVEGAEDAIPFALYGKSELIIVPATLLLTIAAAVTPRSRPFAMWLLLGTLAGATLVLLTLSGAAVSWEVVTAPPWR
ncbi:hypothetical protein EV385_3442 [Krasilnikovia cinnamomea]|uniref:Uncharacterized protein n=1 Tax=Krasilnikovia cinnamomea TaxID=349313 RepID=A0A4Q7ZMV0_9ACTN|nr:hypothetical protein [Krasilnikovia cinnamomea]RZU51609.1 hypothetical protein EV385_3442 [Krasilnikovia cinnamomea]